MKEDEHDEIHLLQSIYRRRNKIQCQARRLLDQLLTKTTVLQV